LKEPAKQENGGRQESEKVLRAKYLDYCSAKVADTLLGLTPDEIFVLAQEAATATGASEELTYDRAVRLATERVSRTLDLPPFAAWLEEYRTDPEQYERHLMGLWEVEDEPDDQA